MAKVQITCPICGDIFLKYPSEYKKHCSRVCYLKSIVNNKQKTLKRKTKNCLACGSSFVPKHTKSPGLYCSYKCRGISNRHKNVFRNGYYYVFMPSHPNSSKQGYIPEHHLIYEGHNKCIIKKGFIIHHKDGDKQNNNIENLEMMTDSEHKSYHAKNRKRGIGGELC